MPKAYMPPPKTRAFIDTFMSYDTAKQDVVWKYQPKGRDTTVGAPVGVINGSSGRRFFCHGSRRYYMPAIAVYLHDGAWPDDRVWAKDGNPNNLRRDNLYIGAKSLFGTRNAIKPDDLAKRRKDPWGHVHPGLKTTIESCIAAERLELARDPSQTVILKEWLLYKLMIYMGHHHDVTIHQRPPWSTMPLAEVEAWLELFS